MKNCKQATAYISHEVPPLKALGHIQYTWKNWRSTSIASRLTKVCLNNIQPHKMSHPATETSYFSMLWEVNFYVKLLCVHVSTFWGKKLGGGGEGTWPLPMLRPWLKYFILNFILTCNTYSHVYTGNRPLWVVFSFVFLILNICPFFIKFVIFLHTYTCICMCK